jgi:hypothetical protein
MTRKAAVEVFDPASSVLRYKMINLNNINVPTGKHSYVVHVLFCQKCSSSVGT